MKQLVAFYLDVPLADSRPPLATRMGDALANLLTVAHVAVISGGDWPQFDKQVASRLPAGADLSRLWLMPTTGTKLYTHRTDGWHPVYAELFDDRQKRAILEAFERSEEPSEGKECVRTCRSRWSPTHKKKKEKISANTAEPKK